MNKLLQISLIIGIGLVIIIWVLPMFGNALGGGGTSGGGSISGGGLPGSAGTAGGEIGGGAINAITGETTNNVSPTPATPSGNMEVFPTIGNLPAGSIISPVSGQPTFITNPNPSPIVGGEKGSLGGTDYFGSPTFQGYFAENTGGGQVLKQDQEAVLRLSKPVEPSQGLAAATAERLGLNKPFVFGGGKPSGSGASGSWDEGQKKSTGYTGSWGAPETTTVTTTNTPSFFETPFTKQLEQMNEYNDPAAAAISPTGLFGSSAKSVAASSPVAVEPAGDKMVISPASGNIIPFHESYEGQATTGNFTRPESKGTAFPDTQATGNPLYISTDINASTGITSYRAYTADQKTVGTGNFMTSQQPNVNAYFGELYAAGTRPVYVNNQRVTATTNPTAYPTGTAGTGRKMTTS